MGENDSGEKGRIEKTRKGKGKNREGRVKIEAFSNLECQQNSKLGRQRETIRTFLRAS
tara:strand:+ start:32 stop:205 length:174 start_codon:yes stop_codon:yes gene_type:complete